MATDAASTSSAPPPPTGGPRGRTLVRYPDRGPLGGVCAGLARYLDVDVTFVRIGAIVLACTGPGVFAYGIAWLVMPKELGAGGGGQEPQGGIRPTRERWGQILGIGLIVLALSVLWGDWWWPGRGWMVPLALIAAGGWLLFRSDDDDDDVVVEGGSPWAPPSPTSVAPAPPAPPADATEVSSDAVQDDLQDDDTVVDATDDDAGPSDDGPPGDGPPTDVLPVPVPPAAPRARRRRVLGPIVFGALLLWGGIAWLTGVEVQDALAVGLCLLGAGFVAGAFIGGSKVLILPAFLVAVALIAVAIVDIPLHGGIGDRRWEVASLRELDDSYELAIGEATLDLSELNLPAGRVAQIEMNVGMGRLEVIVPEGATIDVTAKAGAGDVQMLGYSDEGMGVELERTIRGDSGGDRFELDLHVGLGQIEVYEAAR